VGSLDSEFASLLSSLSLTGRILGISRERWSSALPHDCRQSLGAAGLVAGAGGLAAEVACGLGVSIRPCSAPETGGRTAGVLLGVTGAGAGAAAGVVTEVIVVIGVLPSAGA
jgi:hypothetical protein